MKYQNYIEGSLGKIHKKLVKVGQNCIQSQVAKFATSEILQVAEFLQSCKISAVFQILSLFVPFSF